MASFPSAASRPVPFVDARGQDHHGLSMMLACKSRSSSRMSRTAQKPPLPEPPYNNNKPYAEKSALPEPPYEPYKGM
jgi:hypothetical protein